MKSWSSRGLRGSVGATLYYYEVSSTNAGGNTTDRGMSLGQHRRTEEVSLS
jgi:hypothetical protein